MIYPWLSHGSWPLIMNAVLNSTWYIAPMPMHFQQILVIPQTNAKPLVGPLERIGLSNALVSMLAHHSRSNLCAFSKCSQHLGKDDTRLWHELPQGFPFHV